MADFTRLVCIGDCHFGQPGGRNDDRYRAFDQIVAYGAALAEKRELGAWLLVGDVFHAKSTIDDRNAVAERLQRMAEDAPVVIVQGNHDAQGDLDIFGELDALHDIVVITSPRVWQVLLATGETLRIFGLPYVHRGGLVSAGIAHADLGQEARAALDPSFIAAAAELEEGRAFGELPLLLAHMNIGGAVTSAGQPSIGLEIELDPALLARLGDIPKIFGHIHKPQRLHGADFVGSITRNDFGEREEKRFLVVTFTAPDAWVISTVPIDTPRMVHVKGRLTREAFEILSIDGEPVSPEPDISDAILDGFTGADVKCEYTYVKAEIGALDVAKVHAQFAGARSLRLDPTPLLEHQVRAPEIAAAATLEAKVEAYCGRHGIAYTPALASKLAQLQAQDGAALLSLVSAQLAVAGAQPGDVVPAEREVA